METALALLALLVAVAALVRSARRDGARAAPPAPARPASAAPEPRPEPSADHEGLRRRVEELEARCLALETRPPPAPAPAPVPPPAAEEPADAVSRRLRDRGFEDVRVHPEGPAQSPLRVEAVRGGTVYKGRVDDASTATPEERLRPARRAFP